MHHFRNQKKETSQQRVGFYAEPNRAARAAALALSSADKPAAMVATCQKRAHARTRNNWEKAHTHTRKNWVRTSDQTNVTISKRKCGKESATMMVNITSFTWANTNRGSALGHGEAFRTTLQFCGFFFRRFHGRQAEAIRSLFQQCDVFGSLCVKKATPKMETNTTAGIARVCDVLRPCLFVLAPRWWRNPRARGQQPRGLAHQIWPHGLLIFQLR
jgi:hypothetical protein